MPPNHSGCAEAGELPRLAQHIRGESFEAEPSTARPRGMPRSTISRTRQNARSQPHVRRKDNGRRPLFRFREREGAGVEILVVEEMPWQTRHRAHEAAVSIRRKGRLPYIWDAVCHSSSWFRRDGCGGERHACAQVRRCDASIPRRQKRRARARATFRMESGAES